MKKTELNKLQAEFRLRASEGFTREFWRLWNSGAIDHKTATATEVAAVARVACENIAQGFTPMHPSGRETVRNLRHF